jgi:hypothetical protein
MMRDKEALGAAGLGSAMMVLYFRPVCPFYRPLCLVVSRSLHLYPLFHTSFQPLAAGCSNDYYIPRRAPARSASFLLTLLAES